MEGNLDILFTAQNDHTFMIAFKADDRGYVARYSLVQGKPSQKPDVQRLPAIALKTAAG